MSLAVCLVLVSLAAASPQASQRLLGDYAAGWQDKWRREQLGGGETVYELVVEAGDSVLRARSDGAATALFRPLVDERAAGNLSWRWKVERSLPGIVSERRREGDDYPARLFVIFGSSGLSRSSRALCYVWASREPVGSSYRSPYVDEVETIVLQSGDARAGTWVTEQRDLAADYLRAFGESPPPVGAVALMVDTDDTGSRAVAWYDDIVLY